MRGLHVTLSAAATAGCLTVEDTATAVFLGFLGGFYLVAALSNLGGTPEDSSD